MISDPCDLIRSDNSGASSLDHVIIRSWITHQLTSSGTPPSNIMLRVRNIQARSITQNNYQHDDILTSPIVSENISCFIVYSTHKDRDDVQPSELLRHQRPSYLSLRPTSDYGRTSDSPTSNPSPTDQWRRHQMSTSY